MPDSSWSVISCPDCSARFKTPTDLDEGEVIACPSCGAEVSEEPEPEQTPTILPEPAVTPLDVALQSEPTLETKDGALPPPPKKVVSLDLSGLAVRDANRNPLGYADPDTENAPKLDNLDKIGSTSDEAFAQLDAEPRQRVTSKRAQKEIVGWDDDNAEGRSSSQSTVAGTFKIVLIALPVLIGVGIFALNARQKPKPPPVALEGALGLDGAPNPNGDPSAPPTPPKPEVDPESVDAIFKELGQDDFVELVKTAIEAFLESETLEARLAHCRHPERVRPLMESYYATDPVSPIGYQTIAPQSRIRLERGFAVTGVVLHDAGALPIVLSRSGERLVVDWESFVGYCEMSLDDFIEQKPTEPVLFRLRARPDDYFNFEFSEKDYFCMSLTDLKLTQRIYGYIEKGSDLADQIYTSMAKERGLDFVIVKLRFPADAKADNQVILDEFIDVGWLMKEKA